MSRRLAHLRSFLLLSFASLGVVVACRATRPEGQPMGPRPGPTEPVANPVPKAPDPAPPGPTGPTFPTPEAPGPITVRALPSPVYGASAEVPAQSPPRDAGAAADSALSDAATLPPAIPDAVPTDAAKTLTP